jgi:hypothetical protein
MTNSLAARGQDREFFFRAERKQGSYINPSSPPLLWEQRKPRHP